MSLMSIELLTVLDPVLETVSAIPMFLCYRRIVDLNDVIFEFVRKPFVELLHPVLDGVHRAQNKDSSDLIREMLCL